MTPSLVQPLILGLTGSIASGKSFAASVFRDQDIAVFDADAVVHELYSADAALNQAICDYLPHVCQEGRVERKLLLEHVFSDASVKAWVEGQIHPRVQQAMQHFIHSYPTDSLIVLEVPLLFEKGWEVFCDKTLVMTAPLAVQTERALRRPQLSQKWLEMIQAAQMPDAEKIRRADFVIDSSHGFEETTQQIQQLTQKLLCVKLS